MFDLSHGLAQPVPFGEQSRARRQLGACFSRAKRFAVNGPKPAHTQQWRADAAVSIAHSVGLDGATHGQPFRKQLGKLRKRRERGEFDMQANIFWRHQPGVVTMGRK